MRPLARLTGGGRKSSWVEPPFWTNPDRDWFTQPPGERETIDGGFDGYQQGIFKRNGIVFACITVRQLVFSEARFAWQRLEGGRGTELFGTSELALLERPWPNGTTGELLARMEQDASIAGNFYATVVGTGTERRIRRLRPDWVTIVTGSKSGDPHALDAQPVAYIYEPKAFGAGTPAKAEVLTASEVAHYSPIPDPDAQWRGMSWLTPIIDEIQADTAATRHKKRYFQNGAVPGIIISYDKGIGTDAFNTFVKHFKETHEGSDNAYKTLHLGGGADAKTLAANLQQIDFKATQGAGETRIAAAGGVHPVIVGLSEGLAGSSLNAGNFAAARRRFADGTIRPLWRSAAGALERIIPKPSGGPARLWFDDRDVPFLREDAKEQAEILAREAQTIQILIQAGFDADAAVSATTARDLRRLAGTHSGLTSVQLQPPMLANGNGTPVNALAVDE